MTRFADLAVLSSVTKYLAVIIAIGGVIVGVEVGAPQGAVIAVTAVSAAVGYWVMARVVEILLRINDQVEALSVRQPVATSEFTADADEQQVSDMITKLREALAKNPGKERAALTPNYGLADTEFVAGVAGIPPATEVRVSWIYPDGRLVELDRNVCDADGMLVIEASVPRLARRGVHKVLFETPSDRIEAKFTIY